MNRLFAPAAILTLISSAAAQQCDGLTDFRTWDGRNFACYNNSNAGLTANCIKWDGAASQTGLAHAPCELGSAQTIEWTSEFVNNAGITGFALGFEPGDDTASNPDYLLAVWTNSPQPGLGGFDGLSLYRVTGPLGSGEPALPGAGDFTPLATTSIQRGAEGTSANFVVRANDTGVTIDIDGINAIDVSGNFSISGGRVGLYSWDGQERWCNLTFAPGCPNTTPATSEIYGAGLAGCMGVPTIGIAAPPTIGSNPRISVGTNLTMPTVGAMIWGFRPANVFVPLLGGNLLVSGPFASVDSIAIPAGGFEFVCSIPNDCNQVGMMFVVQGILMDMCNAQRFSLTRGLALTIGV